jgi:hypothetical protein
MHAVRALWSGYLIGKVFETLAVDDEHVTRLTGTASLVEQATQE